MKIQVLRKTDAVEVLSISLEKGTIFPEHSSPREAQLLVLEGNIDFHINKSTFQLSEQQHFNFPKEEKHWVEANENSKFLIIR
ncbi:cupin domain-containing protein [Flagellimonas flava]|uniref:cupin domain-containing protein n=1 Tax=Flagellimonas flava TaxID=570519 RepID=UPI001FE405FF|nr:cupin domain-containing protein [Allomuricauda flava]